MLVLAITNLTVASKVGLAVFYAACCLIYQLLLSRSCSSTILEVVL